MSIVSAEDAQKKEKRKRKKVLSLGCTEIKFHYSVN